MAVKLPGDLRPRGYDVDQSCDYLAQDAFDEHARSCGHCQAGFGPSVIMGLMSAPCPQGTPGTQARTRHSARNGR